MTEFSWTVTTEEQLMAQGLICQEVQLLITYLKGTKCQQV